MDRILSSRFSDGQGAAWGESCEARDEGCTGQLLGRLQPYAIYVPHKPRPRAGYGLTLLLHSLAASYNQFLGSRNQSQFGERGRGHIVFTTESRGPDGWYYDKAGAEVFEVWADIARRYDLAPRRTAIAGYSMGGYGTYKLAAQFPDLFAVAQPTVGPPGRGVSAPPATNPPAATLTTPMLPSLRHVPLLIWNALADELVPVSGVLAHVEELDALGYRYIFDLFLAAEHLTLANNDQYAPAAAWLDEQRVVRDPAHVTYVRNPSMDFTELGMKANHAYWLSGIRLRDPAARGGRGTADAFSHAMGRGDPEPRPTRRTTGTLSGGAYPPIPYTEQSRAWGETPRITRRDRLDLDLKNLSRVRVHVARAGLSCRPKVNVTTDGPVEVVLAGCGRRLSFG